MRSRFALLGLTALLLLAGGRELSADEHIFVSGGPALRFFERHKVNTHDRYWGNFIQGALPRWRQIRGEIKDSEAFTWMLFRPGYITRGKEQNQDLIAEAERMIAPTGAKIIWFNDRDELLHYINHGQDRRKIKIARLEYFGHSNKKNFMFDYSNRLDGAVAEPKSLHLRDLSKINRSAFRSDAYCRSWGCHSGEEYSAAWRRAVGVPMLGAVGKTDYSSGGLPVISTPGGRWVQ